MTSRRIRGTRRLAATLAAAIALVACVSDDDPAANTAGEPISQSSVPAAPESSGTITSGPVAADFPVTVTGANGEVTIAERPERIVVLSSSLTEMVFAVGAGDQVVAVDSYSDHPAEAPTTDLSAFQPNVEAIAEFEPDLVLLARDRDDLVAALDAADITSIVLSGAADLEEVYTQVETIGAITGHAGAASELSEQMRTEIDEQFTRLAGVTVPATYFYEISTDYHTSTSDAFVGSILSATGMTNIADGVDPSAGAYPQLAAEYVLESDPELIVVAHTDGSAPTADEVAVRPGWSTLQAVAGGNIVLLDTDLASRWGPRVVELVTTIVDALVGG